MLWRVIFTSIVKWAIQIVEKAIIIGEEISLQAIVVLYLSTGACSNKKDMDYEIIVRFLLAALLGGIVTFIQLMESFDLVHRFEY